MGPIGLPESALQPAAASACLGPAGPASTGLFPAGHALLSVTVAKGIEMRVYRFCFNVGKCSLVFTVEQTEYPSKASVSHLSHRCPGRSVGEAVGARKGPFAAAHGSAPAGPRTLLRVGVGTPLCLRLSGAKWPRPQPLGGKVHIAREAPGGEPDVAVGGRGPVGKRHQRGRPASSRARLRGWFRPEGAVPGSWNGEQVWCVSPEAAFRTPVRAREQTRGLASWKAVCLRGCGGTRSGSPPAVGGDVRGRGVALPQGMRGFQMSRDSPCHPQVASPPSLCSRVPGGFSLTRRGSNASQPLHCSVSCAGTPS